MREDLDEDSPGEPVILTLAAEAAGDRLDRALAAVSVLSRSRLQQLITTVRARCRASAACSGPASFTGWTRTPPA